MQQENAQGVQNAPQNGEQPQSRGGWFWEIAKMMMMMYVFQNIISHFFKGKSEPPTPQIIGDPRIISAKHLQNLFRPGNEFDFDVYLNYRNPYSFFTKANFENEQPDWSEKNLSYDYSENNKKDLNISIAIGEDLYIKNKTLYLHMQLTAPNPFYNATNVYVAEDMIADNIDDVQGNRAKAKQKYQTPTVKLNQSIPLFKYLPKEKVKKFRNLLDNSPLEPVQQEEESEVEDKFYYPNFKKELYLYLIYDTQVFQYPSGVLPQLAPFLKIDTSTMTYEPIMYLSDYWVLKKDLIPVNETTPELNLTLHFNTFSLNYFLIQKSFEQQQDMYKNYGVESGDMDEMKRMFVETDPILLGVTMFVSLLHTLFEILAFKNDIHFWKSKESMEGISVKSLYTQFFCSIVIFFYLWDNDTSYLILLSSGFGLILEGWKIKKASKVITIEKFPYFKLEDNQKYVMSETKEYDRIAMRYMSYALFPLLVGYAIYSVFYNEHKGWYSFILNTLVGSIYTFGFIQMTPQLYINYRLKTVEHMPGKALFYRFLNTIIDDLFSFIITMPILHRISCFRDDVIFLIYLYQRWAYKVDKTRGPYGSKEETKPEEVKQEQAQSIEEPKDKEQPAKETSTVTHRKKGKKNEEPKTEEVEEQEVKSGKEKHE